MYPQTNMNLSMSQLNTAVANLVSIKEVAIVCWLSPAKVRWRQPAVSSELSLVTASCQ